MNIEKMTASEWILYREEQAEGVKLKPSSHCSFCDIGEDYTCFYCEIEQVREAKQ